MFKTGEFMLCSFPVTLQEQMDTKYSSNTLFVKMNESLKRTSGHEITALRSSAEL